jgi:hypothetical protein
MRKTATLMLLVASACVPEEGPMMTPFQDCLGCHASGGEAKSWTAAGTWAKGAKVSITDSNGKSFTLTGNDAGNFYTAEGLAFPLTVSVNGKVMPDTLNPAQPAKLTYGGCNLCHRAEQVTLTFGPEMLPVSDCLLCHRAGGTASNFPFTAAGSFLPPGSTVRVGNQTATTNSVGNFYITGPIAFPANPTTVGGSSMEDGAPSGSCNAAGCHANFRRGD